MSYESRLSLTVDASTGQQSLKRFRGELGEVERAGDRASRSADSFSGSLSNVRTVALAASGALAAIGIGQLSREVFSTVQTTEKLQASLRTVTGSAYDAAQAWDRLVEFAKTTPFTLDQSVTGFIRMKSLGLDPTTEALTSFGNTASAMGKDLMQMIEAVADASTGEFERLKEFGIRARTEGDNIRFIFQGTETVVRNSADQITKYLQDIGNSEFAGGMEREVDTLGGQLSNLEIQVGQLYRSIGDEGVTDAFKSALSTTSDVVAELTENADLLVAGTKAAAFAAGGAATAYTAYTLATKGATAAQIAFNAAARLNPYVFLATTLAGAAAAIYSLSESFDPAIERAKKLDESIGDLTENLDLLTRKELENRKVSFAQDMIESRAEAERLNAELQTIQDKIRNSGQLTPQGGAMPIATHEDIQSARELASRIDELKLSAESSEGAIAEVERLIASLGETSGNAAGSGVRALTGEALKLAQAWYTARDAAYDSLQSVADKIDPVGAELRSLTADISVVQEAFSRGFITAEQADDIVNALNDPKHWEETGKKSAEAFINPWQSAADTVAQSLQDAIASGDWDDIGDAIGGALGSSIAAIVNKQVTDSLAKDLTANSSTLAQIGGAFAGPIAGAVAGGAIQLALSELSDFFSGSDWDPTEARQAAQGTGSVLGSIDAKSESIRRAVEGSESGIGQLVGINQNMLRALQTLQAGISGASTMVARGYGGLNFAASDQFSASQQALMGLAAANPVGFFSSLGQSAYMGAGYGSGLGGAAFGPIGSLAGGFFGLGKGVDLFGDAVNFIDDISGGLLSDIGSSIFGGSRKVKDLGIQFFGATLDEMIRGWRDGDRYLTAQAYASIEEDGGWFGSDDRWDDFQRLGPEAENQISLVFAGIRESVTAGAEALGMADGEINRALSQFRVATQKISLEDLSAEEQAAELEAVFSKIFDQAAGAVVPYLDDFQQAGEGLGETLSRVANQTLVTQEAVNRLGIQFSDLAGRDLVVASERLMDAAGGVEQFITSMQGFIGNFASEAQKFELAYSDINRALAQSNLQLPSTRDGYYDLLQAQNGATAAGAENIATLLRLQGVANQYYTFLEDAQKSAVDTQVELLQIQRSAISESLREAERASDSVSRALAGLTVQSSSFARLSRDAALASLQSMAASGRIGDQGQLDRALSAATNIQAGEFGTMNDYIRSVSRTGETLQNLKWVTDQQVTKEQRLLTNIEKRIQVMNEEMAAIGAATAKHTAKTAKLLERIENNGLEIRE